MRRVRFAQRWNGRSGNGPVMGGCTVCPRFAQSQEHLTCGGASARSAISRRRVHRWEGGNCLGRGVAEAGGIGCLDDGRSPCDARWRELVGQELGRAGWQMDGKWVAVGDRRVCPRRGTRSPQRTIVGSEGEFFGVEDDRICADCTTAVGRMNANGMKRVERGAL
jgi:hypothetical protein